MNIQNRDRARDLQPTEPKDPNPDTQIVASLHPLKPDVALGAFMKIDPKQLRKAEKRARKRKRPK